jgi:hypothetical protein
MWRGHHGDFYIVWMRYDCAHCREYAEVGFNAQYCHASQDYII